jgi:ketosteroid isomerase-like protein
MMSMSEGSRRDELVGFVAAGFEASSRGEFDAALNYYSDDIEIYCAPGVGNEGTFHGHDGYLAWARQWFEAWDEFEQVPVRTELVGARHIVAETQQRARGRGSGIAIERRLTYLFDIPGELVAAMHLYTSWDEAVAIAEERERSDG